VQPNTVHSSAAGTTFTHTITALFRFVCAWFNAQWQLHRWCCPREHQEWAMAHSRPASVRPRQRPQQQTRTSHLHKKIERMAADLHRSVSGSMPGTRPAAICQRYLRVTPPQHQRHPQLTRWPTVHLQRWSWRSQSELQLARARMPLWQRLPFSVLRVPPTQYWHAIECHCGSAFRSAFCEYPRRHAIEWIRVWAGASCCCGTLGPPPRPSIHCALSQASP
jgi:hypothetical protein